LKRYLWASDKSKINLMEVENTLNGRKEYLKWSDKDKNMVELLV